MSNVEISQVPDIGAAECIFSSVEVDACIASVARAINAHYGRRELLVISVLNGGLIFSGLLLPQLTMPLRVDALRVSRYHNTTNGSELHWHALPASSLRGQRVLLLDDICDHGITLDAVTHWCLEQGALEVESAVLAIKDLQCQKRGAHTPLFHALRVPDRYVFGMGMDYRGYHRNLAGIYALPV